MSEGRYIYKSTEDERRFERSYLNVEEAHTRAKETIAEYEIKPGAFAGLYSATMLQHDENEVARRMQSFEQTPSKKYGDILEAVALEHGELSNWFGPHTEVIKTAPFDDILNGIDMVIESEDEDKRFSHLALGLDVTFGSRDLHRKFENIRAKIDSGDLGEIKYFHSDRQQMTGRLRKVPMVVVGVDIERVKELGLLWMNRRNSELAEHPVQVTLLAECAEQLAAYAAYAARIGKTYTAALFERELQKINDLLTEKKRAGLQPLPDDKVFAEIRRNLEAFSGSSSPEQQAA